MKFFLQKFVKNPKKSENLFQFFKYFLRFFEEKNYRKFLTLPQQNFAIGLAFLAIFQRPWVCQSLWKIEKPFKNCTCWSVEAWDYFFFQKPDFWQIGFFTKYRCFSASKWPQMPHKWVNTIPFGSGHTLGTLNHGLGPLFCCFITLFGAGGTLDPPGGPWCPLAPPWTPWCPNDPWYVILGYSQSSWVIMSHIWPIWSE